MENSQIGLFEQSTQVRKVTEDQYITPLVEILDKSTPDLKQSSKENTPTLKSSLNNLFPEQNFEEKDIQKAKQILGKIADDFTPDQLKNAVTEIQYLVNTWLDDFEREVFDGLTLNELLHEKGTK